jgi:hypothetical protein
MFIKGNKYICIETIKNVFSMPIYEKGEIYEVMWVDDEYVTMNHILYANEYAQHSIKFLEKKFKSI